MLVIKRAIFFVNLLLFMFTLYSIIVSIGLVLGGGKIVFSNLWANLPRNLAGFVLDVTILIGLYGYAFDKIFGSKAFWIVVVAVAIVKTAIFDFDFSGIESYHELIVLGTIIAWQIVTLGALVMYIGLLSNVKGVRKRGR